jgi:hypothetical protein
MGRSVVRDRPVDRRSAGWRVWKPVLLLVALVPVLLGCVAPATAIPSPSPTAIPASPTAIPPSPSVAPSPTPSVTVTALGNTEAEASDRLVSVRTDTPPVVDGSLEDTWEAAEPLRLPLTWGMHGTEHALDVELRSLHTGEAIYFVAQWPDRVPDGPQDTVSNVFTLHWRLPDLAAQRLDCNVACHTAFADGQGRLAYANAETIPQGGSETLEAAGGWEAGAWTLEWSRSLVNGNPYDIQFDDRELAYSFLVKVFLRIEGRPDPVSERHSLVFYP